VCYFFYFLCVSVNCYGSAWGKKREKRKVWVPPFFILYFSPFSSLGPILCRFGREKSKTQRENFFLNSRIVIWRHKLLNILKKIRSNLLTHTKNLKNYTLILKIHFLLEKNTFSQCRKPKRQINMADIKTIDSRNREVNNLYSEQMLSYGVV
jgi:hypothetical protein